MGLFVCWLLNVPATCKCISRRKIGWGWGMHLAQHPHFTFDMLGGVVMVGCFMLSR